MSRAPGRVAQAREILRQLGVDDERTNARSAAGVGDTSLGRVPAWLSRRAPRLDRAVREGARAPDGPCHPPRRQRRHLDTRRAERLAEADPGELLFALDSRWFGPLCR